MITMEKITLGEKKKIEALVNSYNSDVIKAYNKSFNDRKNRVLDKDYYLSYMNSIKECASLFHELGIYNPFHSSVVFEYLLWNGYFSRNKSLIFSLKERVNNLGVMGADVMLGKAVCVNSSAMLSDLLHEMEFVSYILGCKVNGEKAKFEYQPDIKRNFVEKRSTFDKILKFIIRGDKIIGDHAVTSFKYQGVYYVVDPITLSFLNFNDFLKMQYIGSPISCEIKPVTVLAINDIKTESELFHLLVEPFMMHDEVFLSLDEVKTISEESLEICKDNISLLDDFHDYIKKDIDVVCKNLKK